MIHLNKYICPVLNDIIEKDTKFLAEFEMIDYSLLLTLENIQPNQKVICTNNRKLSVDGKTVIHLGIIDYLQEFNLAKYIEMKWRSLGKNE